MKKILLSLLVLLLMVNPCRSGVDFDGGTDYVGIDFSVPITIYPCTVSFWVNLDSNSEQGVFVNIGDTSGGASGDGFGIGVGANTFENSGNVGNELIILYNGVRWIDTNTNIGTGWHHILVTLDASGYPTVYLDGSNIYNDSTGAPRNDFQLYTFLGGYTKDGYDRYVDCEMTEVAVWNKVLSTAEISLLASSRIKQLPLQLSSANLKAYWSFDDYLAGSSPTVGRDYNHANDANCQLYWDLDTDESPIQDLTTNNRDGTLKGANEPDYVTAGVLVGTGAYSFDGTDDNITRTDASGLDNTNTTIMCWVNLDSTSESGAFIKVGDNNDGFAIGVGNTNFDTEGNQLIVLYEAVSWVQSGVGIGTGWHHVALTIDASQDPKIFLDGIQIYTTALNANTPGAETYIGGYTGSGSENRFVDAEIDEVAFYNTDLTASQISQIVNSSLYYDKSGNNNTLFPSGNTNTSETVLSYPSTITQ